MTNQPGFRREEPSDGEKRFDEDTAQRILRRAAEEQTRWETEARDSFTLAQLEEIATEAGISLEAVRAAARELEAPSDRATSALPGPGGDPAGGWLARLKRRMPASWSPALQNAVLIGAGVALVGLVISVVGVGPVMVAVTAVVLALILLALVGLGPF
jgi:Flp pilus assembly protein TadB